uniref:Translation initiation factor 5A-like N-terminal domain-containing protein n=1 Tax=Brassica oleracea var. oleracea TaxID=109376 RepID=A0A0D3DPL5_BRAOL
MLIDCLDQLEGPVVSRFSVVEVSTTDEDGNAKCHFVGIDIFNGDKLEETVPSSDNCDPSQARRVYTAASPLLMNIRSKFRQIRPFPTVKVTRSAPSSAQIRIRHAPRFQQDSNLIICKADAAWEALIHGSLGQSYIGSLLIAEVIAMRLAFCMVQILEFPKLKVFTDISTLFRAISGNLQSKEIIGIVKDIRSISSGFASIFSCFSTLANVSAKEALKAFLSLY